MSEDWIINKQLLQCIPGGEQAGDDRSLSQGTCLLLLLMPVVTSGEGWPACFLPGREGGVLLFGGWEEQIMKPFVPLSRDMCFNSSELCSCNPSNTGLGKRMRAASQHRMAGGLRMSKLNG